MNIPTVLYRDSFRSYEDGCPINVSVKSEVIGVESVKIGAEPVGCPDTRPVKLLLKINDPEQGILWIDETMDSFHNKINNYSTIPGVLHKLLRVGAGLDIEVGDTVYTAEWLKGVTIIDITYLKEMYKDFYSVTAEIIHNQTTGSLDFTPAFGVDGLLIEDYVSITYTKGV